MTLIALAGCLSTPLPPLTNDAGSDGTGDGATGDGSCAGDTSAVFPFAAVLDDPDHLGLDRLVRGGTCRGKPALLVYDPAPTGTFSLVTPRQLELPAAAGVLRAIGPGRPGAVLALVATASDVTIFDVTLTDGATTVLVAGAASLDPATAWIAGVPVVPGAVLFGASSRYWRVATSTTSASAPGAYADIANGYSIVTARFTIRPSSIPGWAMAGPAVDRWLPDTGTIFDEETLGSPRVVGGGWGSDGSNQAPLSIAVNPQLMQFWVDTPTDHYANMISGSPTTLITAVGAAPYELNALLAVVTSTGVVGTARLVPGTGLLYNSFGWTGASFGAPSDGLVLVGQFDTGFPQVHVISPQAGAEFTANSYACLRVDVANQLPMACSQ